MQATRFSTARPATIRAEINRGIARRTEPDRLGVHLAAQDARNRARLAEIDRKYRRYDARRDPWYVTLWIALWLGWTVAREVIRNG